MKVVLQRVKNASVFVANREISSIEKGFLLLVGISKDDTTEKTEKMAEKIKKLRVFEDENGKMNLDINEINGEILSVSQFTLLGDTKKGNRPGFDEAASPEKAKELWDYFNLSLRNKGIIVKTGEFAAKMEVKLLNDGPVTFMLEN